MVGKEGVQMGLSLFEKKGERAERMCPPPVATERSSLVASQSQRLKECPTWIVRPTYREQNNHN